MEWARTLSGRWHALIPNLKASDGRPMAHCRIKVIEDGSARLTLLTLPVTADICPRCLAQARGRGEPGR